MAAGKEIRTKIKSVQNTQKITKAMQMVATSKMRKTQDLMYKSRPYTDKVREVIAHLANINPTARSNSAFLRKPETYKKVGMVLITTDKGLCGGLNTNAIKLFAQKVDEFIDAGVEVDVTTVGQKGLIAAKKMDVNIASSLVALGDIPDIGRLVGPLRVFIEGFKNKEYDAVYIVYSEFVNTMKQAPLCEQLLPLNDDKFEITNKHSWDYIYEPSPDQLLDVLIKRYLESVTYQFLAENMASEQASRMMAMRAATDNAGEAIHQLSLAYNKSRQAAITKELAEIVAGAAAV